MVFFSALVPVVVSHGGDSKLIDLFLIGFLTDKRLEIRMTQTFL